MGAGVGEDPEFCLIIKGEASCVCAPWFRHSFLKLHFRPVLVYVDESFFCFFKIQCCELYYFKCVYFF